MKSVVLSPDVESILLVAATIKGGGSITPEDLDGLINELVDRLAQVASWMTMKQKRNFIIMTGREIADGRKLK